MEWSFLPDCLQFVDNPLRVSAKSVFLWHLFVSPWRIAVTMSKTSTERLNSVLAPIKASAKGSINLNMTMDSFNTEFKSFIEKRGIPRPIWVSFVFLCLANTLNLLTFVSPGWGWTREVNGEFLLQGEYYAWYGLWYTCWRDVNGEGRRQCANLRKHYHLSSEYTCTEQDMT